MPLAPALAPVVTETSDSRTGRRKNSSKNNGSTAALRAASVDVSPLPKPTETELPLPMPTIQLQPRPHIPPIVTARVEPSHHAFLHKTIHIGSRHIPFINYDRKQTVFTHAHQTNAAKEARDLVWDVSRDRIGFDTSTTLIRNQTQIERKYDDRHYNRIENAYLVACAQRRLATIRSGGDPDADAAALSGSWDVSTKITDDSGHASNFERECMRSWPIRSPKHYQTPMERTQHVTDAAANAKLQQSQSQQILRDTQATQDEWDEKEGWNGPNDPIIIAASARPDFAAIQKSIEQTFTAEELTRFIETTGNYLPETLSPKTSASSQSATVLSRSSRRTLAYEKFLHSGKFEWANDESDVSGIRKRWSCCGATAEFAKGCACNSDCDSSKAVVIRECVSGGRRRQSASVLRYHHSGTWQANHSNEDAKCSSQWSCCGKEDEKSRGCVQSAIVRRNRWQYE